MFPEKPGWDTRSPQKWCKGIITDCLSIAKPILQDFQGARQSRQIVLRELTGREQENTRCCRRCSLTIGARVTPRRHSMRTALQEQTPLRLLGVYAHPDDETFCAGGTLAKYAAAGADMMVVSMTQGEAGQIRTAQAATRHTLGQARAQELQRACRELGVQHA